MNGQEDPQTLERQACDYFTTTRKRRMRVQPVDSTQS
jgi:hypothetical protein